MEKYIHALLEGFADKNFVRALLHHLLRLDVEGNQY